MANTNKPFGFSPVKSLVGGGFPGQGNMYYIANDASNTYAIGDVVMSSATADANGVRGVTKWGGATTTSALPLGIITGFAVPPYGSTALQGAPLSLEKQWLAKSSGAQYVFVCDDPNVVFEAQFDSTVITTTTVSGNAAVTVTADQSTLSEAAPLSSTVLTSPAVTATLPIRLLGAKQVQNNVLGAYVVCLCKWNYHENGVIGSASGTVVSYLAP